MSEPLPAKKSLTARLVPWLKGVVALLLIALVVHFVPIRDEVSWVGADGGRERWTGRIVEWRDGEVLFRRSDGDAPGLYVLELSTDAAEGAFAVAAIRRPDGTTVPIPGGARLSEGVVTVCRNADLSWLALGVFLVLLGSSVAIVRWAMLLRAAGAVTPFWRAVALTFIGLFFNNVMPGLTGGDLVKAVYIARQHPMRKTEAILTVLVDRILGITGLACVAGLVVPFRWSEFAVVAPWIYGLLSGLALFGTVFFSRRLRALLRVDRILARLPLQRFVQRIDQAVFLYRYRKRVLGASLVLSMLVHLVIVGGISVMGRGIGLDVPVATYFAIMPIVLIVMALPISPAGLGTGEAAGVYFWSTQGISGSQAVSLLLVYRMSQLLVSLLGGVFLAFETERVRGEEIDRFEREAG